MIVKAIMYSLGNGFELEVFPTELLKKDFNPDNYKKQTTSCFSENLMHFILNIKVKIKGITLNSLHFNDGSCYEFGNGWRKMELNGYYVRKVFVNKI